MTDTETVFQEVTKMLTYIFELLFDEALRRRNQVTLLSMDL